MKETVLVFLAPGFEEVEALAQVDILRRGEVLVKTVAVSDDLLVKGAHGIEVKADMLIADLPNDVAPLGVVLPGGMPGATNLYANAKLVDLVKRQHNAKRLLAAICASPGVVLAQAGVLSGHKATAYPSFEKYFDASTTHRSDGVVVDGHVITGQGPAYSITFGLTCLKALKGEAKSKEVADGMLVACDC